MKTVILITMATKDIPNGMYNWVSKNEPSRNQIENMLREIGEELNHNWELKYIDFDQVHSKSKLYTYHLNDETCLVLVERRDLIEFPK